MLLDGRSGSVQAVLERQPWRQQCSTAQAARLIQVLGWEICEWYSAQLIWMRRNPWWLLDRGEMLREGLDGASLARKAVVDAEGKRVPGLGP